MTTPKRPAGKKSVLSAMERVGTSPTASLSSGVSEPPAVRVVKVHEAKTTLSKLIQLVEHGGRVVIARGDTAVAELVPVRVAAAAGRPRQFGALRGVVALGPAFFDPLPADELAAWE